MYNVYYCKECGSSNLLVYEINCYYFNTSEFYCNSVKTYDSNAVVKGLDCNSSFTVNDYEE